MQIVKRIFKPIIYFIFRIGASFKTSFFSNFFIAAGYFIKAEYEFNKTNAIEYKEDRFEFHDLLSTQFISIDEKLHYFEFGVRWGQIINKWALNNNNKDSFFAGFDTFTGIPEDWGSVKKGSFSNQGNVPTPADERVKFYVGLVQDTLPSYLSTIDTNAKMIIHLDFDIYNATLFALLQLMPYIKKGDVIILDEYFSVTKNHHEYRAFHDYLSIHKVNYIPKYKCRGGQYAIEIS